MFFAINNSFEMLGDIFLVLRMKIYYLFVLSVEPFCLQSTFQCQGVYCAMSRLNRKYPIQEVVKNLIFVFLFCIQYFCKKLFSIRSLIFLACVDKLSIGFKMKDQDQSVYLITFALIQIQQCHYRYLQRHIQSHVRCLG